MADAEKGGQATGRLDVLGLLELRLPEIVEDFHFEIVEDSFLDVLALTRPDQWHMQVRQSVYDSAMADDGRHRFTLAHEVGHLFLHQGAEAYARRASYTQTHKAYEDSEWQADYFAAELLMPYEEVKAYLDVYDIAEDFGVSLQAAEIRMRNVKK